MSSYRCLRYIPTPPFRFARVYASFVDFFATPTPRPPFYATTPTMRCARLRKQRCVMRAACAGARRCCCYAGMLRCAATPRADDASRGVTVASAHAYTVSAPLYAEMSARISARSMRHATEVTPAPMRCLRAMAPCYASAGARLAERRHSSLLFVCRYAPRYTVCLFAAPRRHACPMPRRRCRATRAPDMLPMLLTVLMPLLLRASGSAQRDAQRLMHTRSALRACRHANDDADAIILF